MSLLSLSKIQMAFGGPPVLDDVTLDIHKGQRISFLGRNGAGKSTLMKIIAGLTPPDGGEIITSPGTRTAYLPQDIPVEVGGSVYEIVARGAGSVGEDLISLHNAAVSNPDPAALQNTHTRIDELDGWRVSGVVDKVISLTQLDADAQFSTLSGGMKRRVLLARALVNEPDLLLLDEPTNHMDIDSINWLESFILGSKLTVLFVTHDRRLLRRIATRIIELDRGKLVDWSCDYDTFLHRKQAILDAEEKSWELFDKKLAQEEVWIRKGIKARRTRNEGRVRALKKLREERKKRRERSGTVSMEISQAGRSGNRVLEVENLSFSYDGKPIVKDVTTTVMRGDRVGIIGPNGCGKTTFLDLLLGKQKPRAGEVRAGTNVEVSYFDQFREVLDPEKTVWENVAPGGGDTVFVNGSPKHVISYLRDFLFTSERAKSPVKQLSGGERNRLMLARMFTKPANVLVLDEPTNDLDTDTLELLEELLSDFAGTVLVVSHDREFLNNIVTSVFAFEGDGVVKEYVGGYDDWERQSSARKKEALQSMPVQKKKKEPPAAKDTPRKLTYREKKELESLPGLIERLESEYSDLGNQISDPQNLKKQGFASEAQARLQQIDSELEEAYGRWEELEGV
ncbi:MAG: ATP-binding cassette domain-containing protein [Fibrobacterota bacterium]